MGSQMTVGDIWISSKDHSQYKRMDVSLIIIKRVLVCVMSATFRFIVGRKFDLFLYFTKKVCFGVRRNST